MAAAMIMLQGHSLIVIYLALWGLFFVGEVWLASRRRATANRAPEDRGFLSQAWLVFLLSNFVAVACLRFRFAAFGSAETSIVGLALLGVGLLLRWWSIAYLGRFFTVDVAIAANHQVIDSGPYRILRHPSYAGALLSVLGIALCFGNYYSAAVLIVPYLFLALRRMSVEEAALSDALGDAYRNYMSRTKRLIPGIY
jgi:protein-S-isoprenylcysteine O-methyltransferase